MEQVIIPLIFGFLVGLALGLVGGGGSILTVPILVYIMGESVHLATGTALAIVGANALIGAWDHGRAGRVHLPIALLFGGVGIVGAFVGTWFNHLVSGRIILLGFAVLMLIAAVALMLVPLNGRQMVLRQQAWSWSVLGTGVLVGVLTGFFGVGGGFLIIPALVLVLGLSMRLAVGTSLVIIAINAAAALIGHIRFGGIDLPVTLLFVLGGAFGSILGSRVSTRLDEQRLRIGFAILIVLIALTVIVRTCFGNVATI